MSEWACALFISITIAMLGVTIALGCFTIQQRIKETGDKIASACMCDGGR